MTVVIVVIVAIVAIVLAGFIHSSISRRSTPLSLCNILMRLAGDAVCGINSLVVLLNDTVSSFVNSINAAPRNKPKPDINGK